MDSILALPAVFWAMAMCATGPDNGFNNGVSSRMCYCCFAMIPIFSACSALGITFTSGPMYGLAACFASIVCMYASAFMYKGSQPPRHAATPSAPNPRAYPAHL